MLPSATTWMNTEGSMLSETSQRKTSTIRISLICGILKKKKKKKISNIENRLLPEVEDGAVKGG